MKIIARESNAQKRDIDLFSRLVEFSNTTVTPLATLKDVSLRLWPQTEIYCGVSHWRIMYFGRYTDCPSFYLDIVGHEAERDNLARRAEDIPEPAEPAEILIKTTSQIVRSGLNLIMARAALELAENDWDDGTLPYSYNSSAIYAECLGKVVGVLAYRAPDWLRRISIEVGYVLPEFRRRGIYTSLFEKLVEVSIEGGFAVCIWGGVDIRNTAMQRVAEAQGRKLVALEYEYPLPARDPQT